MNSLNTINKKDLSEQTKLLLTQVINIEHFFYDEITAKNKILKKVVKIKTTLDYVDNILIGLTALSSGVCIASSGSVIGIPLRIAGGIFALVNSILIGIIKKVLSVTKNKKKKHSRIMLLAKNKFSKIEELVSQALIDTDISHDEFLNVLNKKKKYENLKYTISRENSIKNDDNINLKHVHV